ncbi:MAG: outer membrane lipoprotein carrier protein LolA [Gemmatimonadales bacterium]|jgi:outer membrane lipoprotein carrier protein|nr:outer membrane lipoprotein carrier protein LolA [Gemmatimonadales bacterium]
MRRRLAALPLAVALAWSLPAGATAQSTDGEAIAARSARVYRSLTSLTADFTQTIEDEALGRLESRGTLVQAGQNKLAMRFSDPKGEAIVIDGTHVWVYTPSTTPGQVIRSAVPTGASYGFNILAWLLDRPTERYRITYLRRDFVDFVPVDVLEFQPRSSDLPFRRAVLWIDRDTSLPRRLEIEEQPGAVRTLSLARIRTNQPVTASTFRFDVPSGVRVIEQ